MLALPVGVVSGTTAHWSLNTARIAPRAQPIVVSAPVGMIQNQKI